MSRLRFAALLVPLSILTLSVPLQAQTVTFVEAYFDGQILDDKTINGLGFANASAVSPDGANLYVCSGNRNISVSASDDNALAIFRRQADTGRLTFVEALFDMEDVNDPGAFEGLSSCRDVIVSPDGRHVYTAAFSDAAIGIFQRTAPAGSLHAIGKVRVFPFGTPNPLVGVTDLAFAPDGSHLFAVAALADSLLVFARDPATGALTMMDSVMEGVGGVAGLDRPLAVAVSPDGKSVYTAAGSDSNFSGSDALAVFSWNAGEDDLSQLQVLKDGMPPSVTGLAEVSDVIVSPDGRHVYTAATAFGPLNNQGEVTAWLSIFERSPASGELLFKDSVASFFVCDVLDAGAVTDNFLAFSPDGRRLYATKASSSALAVFSRDVESGQLEFRDATCLFDDPELSLGINLPKRLSIDPEGHHVYVPGSASNSIALFETRPPLGDLLFPVAALDLGFTGLAFVNRTDQDRTLDLDYFPAATAPMGISAAGFAGAFLELPRNSQKALVTADLFPNDPVPAWIGARNGESITSFFQFGLSDLSALDGGIASQEVLPEFWITRVLAGTDVLAGGPARTELSFFNPGSAAVEARFEYVSSQTTLGTTRILPGYSVLVLAAVELFDAETLDGYLHIETLDGPGLVGFARIDVPTANSPDRPKSLLGLSPTLAGTAGKLYSAQFVHASGANPFFTDLNLINLSSERRSIALVATDDNGNPLPLGAVELEPGEQFKESAGNLLAASPQLSAQGVQSFVGSLIVEPDGPGVVGDVVFGDPSQLSYVAALGLQQQSFSRAIFGQVAVIPAIFFTGLAFFNPGEMASEVTVTVYQTDGDLTGTAEFMLEPGHRTSRLVEQFVPAASNQAGGFIVVDAGSEIVGQMLFGSLGGPTGIRLLSAVPPIILP